MILAQYEKNNSKVSYKLAHDRQSYDLGFFLWEKSKNKLKLASIFHDKWPKIY